jgi:hypothetical protein
MSGFHWKNERFSRQNRFKVRSNFLVSKIGDETFPQRTTPQCDIFPILCVSHYYIVLGLGKLTYTFSAERLQISAPRQASVGRASRLGSRKQKSADIERKTYMLICSYPIVSKWV